MNWKNIDLDKLEETNKKDKSYKKSKKRKTKKSNHKHDNVLVLQICNYSFSNTYYFVDFVNICKICGKVTLPSHSSLGLIRKIKKVNIEENNTFNLEEYLLKEIKELFIKENEKVRNNKISCLNYWQNDTLLNERLKNNSLEVYYSDKDLFNINSTNDTKFIGYFQN